MALINVISNQETKGKNAGPIRFSNLCAAVTTGGDIFNQAAEAKMTMHISFINLCTNDKTMQN